MMSTLRVSLDNSPFRAPSLFSGDRVHCLEFGARHALSVRSVY